jgi:hypothetical protein
MNTAGWYLPAAFGSAASLVVACGGPLSPGLPWTGGWALNRRPAEGLPDAPGMPFIPRGTVQLHKHDSVATGRAGSRAALDGSRQAGKPSTSGWNANRMRAAACRTVMLAGWAVGVIVFVLLMSWGRRVCGGVVVGWLAGGGAVVGWLVVLGVVVVAVAVVVECSCWCAVSSWRWWAAVLGQTGRLPVLSCDVSGMTGPATQLLWCAGLLPDHVTCGHA